MEDLTSELWRATINGEYNKAYQLICSGADVNEPRDSDFDPVTTLLHYATKEKNIQLMSLFIQHGANYNARDSVGRTPLHWATMGYIDNPVVVDLLISAGAIVDTWSIDKYTPFLMAVKNNYHHSAEMLVAKGASIEVIEKTHGWGALHYATVMGDLRMMKMLISQKINIDGADSVLRYTPLHYASVLGKTDKVCFLLDNGADLNKRAIMGDSPLSLAVYGNYPAIVHSLLKRGARINEVTDAGDTALHKAVEYEFADVADLLVKFGADMNVVNRMGKTALQLLQTRPYREAVAKIIIREVVKREALGQPICEGYRQMAQYCEEYSKFDLECREEIKHMRSQTIEEDSNVSFFYVFSKKEEDLVPVARNENIVTAFEISDYLTLFRIYAVDLTTNFEKAKRRANFVMSVEDCLVGELGDILPTTILQKIAGYFEYVDIIEKEL